MTTPSSVTLIAVERAIVLLTAAKAEFAIRTVDGAVFGTLLIAEPASPKRTRRRVNNFRAMYPGYIDQVKAMSAGEVLRWECATKALAEAFRSSVSATLSEYHGNGNGISTVTGHDPYVVEVLRVA